MTKPSELSNDELVKLIVQLRDRRRDRKKEDDADKEKIDKLSGILLARYNEMGIESARTKYGTAFKMKVGHGSIADRDVVRDLLVSDPHNWGLVTLMPNKAGIKEYIDEHNDLPPGFNWYEEIEMRVNRA